MNDSSQPTSLSSSVLERIEGEQVTPRSRVVFLTRDYGLWALWLFSVLLGAVSVAVTLSVLAHGWYALYELTHDSASRFWFEALPYLWFWVFLAMTMAAIYNLRHTKRGYRYSLLVVLGSSLGCSVVLGVLMQIIGLGFLADKQLGQYSVLYESQAEREERYWQRPEAGRLVGMFLMPPVMVGPLSPMANLRDALGIEWEMNLAGLTESERQQIIPGKLVRVVGLVQSQEPPRFYACRVLPWIFEYEHTLHELAEIRRGVRKALSEADLPPTNGEMVCVNIETLHEQQVPMMR